MANPVLIKTVIAVGSDKRVQKIIASIVVGAIFAFLLPIFIIVSIMSSGAGSNKNIVEIVFNNEKIPNSFSTEQRDYISKMQNAFAKLDIEVNLKNQEIDDNENGAVAKP